MIRAQVMSKGIASISIGSEKGLSASRFLSQLIPDIRFDFFTLGFSAIAVFLIKKCSAEPHFRWSFLLLVLKISYAYRGPNRCFHVVLTFCSIRCILHIIF